MNKNLLILFCLFSLMQVSRAQDPIFGEPQHSTLSADSLSDVVGLIPESLDANVDSLLHSWHVQYFSKVDEYCHDDAENVYFPDSVYEERLERLPSVIRLPYNEVVRDCIDLYAGRKRDLVRYMLGMADFYFPIIEQVLDKHNLPLELKYLAVVESALNPVALSRVGACGLWQFMLRTGQVYGLKVNSLVDERRDPVKSTRAAARYLKDLYDIYQDWNLVLAAYNCGPGTINKAIRRAGGEKDFWKIYNFLPKETRGYVPAFVAANYIMTYYCEHYISPMEMNMPESTDTVHINRSLNLNQVAEVCKVDIDQLRALNPEFKKDIIPGNEKPYALRLPTQIMSYFIDHEDSIYNYKPEVFQTRRSTVTVSNTTAKGKNSGKAVYHRIRNGETLGGIAAKYGVSVSQLRRLNGIKGSNIRAGKSLRIR